jgi:hypothetical protein
MEGAWKEEVGGEGRGMGSTSSDFSTDIFCFFDTLSVSLWSSARLAEAAAAAAARRVAASSGSMSGGGLTLPPLAGGDGGGGSKRGTTGIAATPRCIRVMAKL